MTKVLGLGTIGIINSLENVKNPRPIVIEAVDKGKSSIAHLFTAEDIQRGWQISSCGAVKMFHTGYVATGESYWKTDPLDIKGLEKNALICPDCLKAWNEFLQSRQLTV